MKSWFAWTLFVLAIAAVADGYYAYQRYFARDGSTVTRAIVIPKSEHQLEDEYAWVAKHPEGAVFPVEQALFCRRGRLYERWTFGTSNQREVYFDLGIDKEICDAKSESGFTR
jgi:hypothetical protein